MNYATTKPHFQMLSQAYDNYAVGTLQVIFSYSFVPPTDILMSCLSVCYGVHFLLSGSHVAAMFINGGLTNGVCDTTTL